MRRYGEYTAVCPGLGKQSALVLQCANTTMMNLFLVQVSGDFQEYFVLMLMDRTNWYVSQKLTMPENIRIIRQPLQIPELNPAKHIWDYIRETISSTEYSLAWMPLKMVCAKE